LGGVYFFVNALKSVASWFVAAALYSRYGPAATIELGLVAGVNTSAANYSGFVNSTGANVTGANTNGATLRFCPGFSRHLTLLRPPQVPSCTRARSVTCRSL
jgi:hypothetical protein